MARTLAPLAFALVAAACDNSSEPSTPSALAPVTANPITGQARGVVPVTVRVTASNGRALPGQTVTFTVAGGGGTVAPATATTNESGDATAQWTLGGTVGVQTLNAQVGTLTPLTISANVTAGAPATVAISAGNGQTGAVGTALATRPAVVVRDAANNPVAGVQVNFAVTQGGGSIASGTILTDASGVATGPQWTLGPTAGPQTLQATVLANGVTGNPLSFTATATAGAPARVEAAPGTQGTQTARVATALASAALPAVVVRDASGNPVPNVAVTFAITGGGTGTGLTATTDANGVARLGGFTLPNTVGTSTITATAAGVQGSAAFLVTGTAGPAASGAVAGGNNQEVRAGGTLQVGPSVRVVDQFGNPVAGATVNFVVTSGGASLLGSTQTTNAQGIATVGGVTLGATPGTATIEARIAGVTAPVVFTATGLAGAPATITLVSGDSLTVQAFKTATVPFVVQLRDTAGFPVRNATVTFTIAQGGGGALSATTVQTDAQGNAQVFYSGTGILGTTTVTATVAGSTLTPVVFTVTTVPNTPASVTATTPTTVNATAGTIVGTSPTVVLRDAAGTPVPGVQVLFNTIGGGVQFPVDTTDANGVASAGLWQLGSTPGEYVVSAIVSYPGGNIANNPIRFTANATALPPNVVIAKSLGDAQTATAGTVLSTQPAVLVTSNGAPAAGVTVQFVASGDGTATPVYVQTDASGIARTTWKLSSVAGANTLTVLVPGAGAAVIFNATGQ